MELSKQVETSLTDWIDCWDGMSAQASKPIFKISRIKQIWNYIRIRRITKKCYKTLERGIDPEDLMPFLEKDILKLAQILLNISKDESASLLQKTYASATKDFVNEVRRFDEDMDAESIFQALRNVWIMHSIQVLHGQEPKHSPAIFGYSMLYPLTDNYLDDGAVSSLEKTRFNGLFRKRLQGQVVSSDSRQLKDVFSMVERMERSFPRQAHKKVWESILLIQTAQEDSLKQQGGYQSLSERQIKRLSFMKGGTSVLADGYLVCGDLSPEWIHFLLGYGILLQLADDLQDMYSDAEASHWTLFSTYYQQKTIDSQIEKLRNFAYKVFESFPGQATPSSTTLVKVMQKAVDYLIFDATIHVQKNCQKTYLQVLEKQFPVNVRQQEKLNLVWKAMTQGLGPRMAEYKQIF